MLYLDDSVESITEEQTRVWTDELPAWRRSRVEAIRDLRVRALSVAAFRLLRSALREEYGMDPVPVFGYGAHGKPFLTGFPDIHFSLSHCRAAVACAVSDHPVGVDVEVTGRGNERLFAYVLSESERALVRAAADPQEAFTRLWTRKEAFLKLTGSGLSDSLPSVLESAAARGALFDTRYNAARGYACTVARF